MLKLTWILVGLAALCYAWTRLYVQTHPRFRWMPYEGERRAGR